MPDVTEEGVYVVGLKSRQDGNREGVKMATV